MQPEDPSNEAATTSCRETPLPTSHMPAASRPAFSKVVEVQLEELQPFSSRTTNSFSSCRLTKTTIGKVPRNEGTENQYVRSSGFWKWHEGVKDI